MQFIEKVLWKTEYIKNKFQNFVPNISHRMIIYGQVGQLSLTVIK